MCTMSAGTGGRPASQPSVQHLARLSTQSAARPLMQLSSLPPGLRRQKQQQQQQQQQQHCRRGRRPLQVAAAQQGGDDQPDLIERLVGSIFGKKALSASEPFGMKRLDNPEMYTATTTEQAAPVAKDSTEVATFRPLLAKTQLEEKPLRLAYDASQHGWSASTFHRGVDTFGAAVVVARTAGGAVLGGYSPRGWIGLGEDRDSMAAFLFCWPDGNTSQPAIKLPKVGGPSLAVASDRADYGIQFGAEGLTIALQRDNPRLAKCRLGTFYARLPSGGRSMFAAEESPKGTELVELRVYVAEGKGEEWKLDGIIWKTSDA